MADKHSPRSKDGLLEGEQKQVEPTKTDEKKTFEEGGEKEQEEIPTAGTRPMGVTDAVSEMTGPALRKMELEDFEAEKKETNKPNMDTHPASGATSPRSKQSVHSLQLRDSGETGVVTSPMQDDSAFHFSGQLSRDAGSEEEEPSEDEEEQYEAHAAETEESEEEEEDTELVVMDPNHPLMKRFQSALKNHLTRQLEKLNLNLREELGLMKKHTSEREELGMMLYGVQQELARMQMGLEKQHDQNTQAATMRKRVEDELENTRQLFKRMQQNANDERSKVSKLQTEVDNLALRLFYMQNVNEDVRSDISLMKHATQKAETEKAQVEDQKMKQDLFVDRLTKEVDKLREMIAIYEVQTVAQAEETKAAKEALSEAHMEIEAIAIEKKQLFQQWNSSLIGMRRRDEAYTAMQEALRQSKQLVQSLDTEIEGYKKSITKEEEQNEQLTVILNRAEYDANMSKKLISQCLARQEALKAEYSTYTRTLNETEKALIRVNMDHAKKFSELTLLRTLIEKECATKLELGDKILHKMQEQMTLDKSAKYARRQTEKLASRKRALELQLTKLENDLGQVTLETNNSNIRLSSLQKTLATLDEEMHHKHELISRSESEIAKCCRVIERKQSTINLYNKKIDNIHAKTGGEELGPLAIQIKNLSKEIEQQSSEISSMQQYWLRQQNELVFLTKEREEQAVSVETLKKHLTILQQKKVRTENEIQQEMNEQKDIERHMKNLSNDMLKLNMILSKNNSLKEALQQGNSLMETEFVHKLKEAERESIEMQMKLERLQEEKERLLNSLVEAERQIMLWEKKTQLGKETRDAVDSDIGKGEMRSMRAEIHRMEVRYGQLMKQQEKLIREMEAVVARRETIVTRGEAQNKMEKKQPTHSEFHNKMQALQKKIEETQKQARECNGVIQELQDTQKSLSSTLDEKHKLVTESQATTDMMTQELKQLQDKKERNFSRFLAFQTRLKHFQSVKDGTYSPLVKTEALESEIQKQEDRIHAVSTIIDRICHEYPQHQGALRKVSLALAGRMQAPDEIA
ncbi:coiled-coil domain-containing protein 40 isoform X1 [Acipenser ruthenus]|uniref:coiled-coil domain-containing protein 40 isoform X1 n=1 Tax=Acipenser ruthenus TaxID=7906 RepID=UPI0027409822|nr:coiled-coil domain-containing protein 40 isoform X1 [Acipenser ruthenus]